MDTQLPNEIADYYGILRDEEINKALLINCLLTKDSSDSERIRQASYELRLSNEVERLVLQDGEEKASAKYERPANGVEKTLRIDPGQTVKAQVMEYFNLPNDVVAHIIPVGNIYKIGLSPETTFADPGFEGAFYIVLSNYSHRVVELNVGQPIARVEFFRLAKATKRPHPGAKHTSEPPIWPRRVQRPTMDELKSKGLDVLLEQLGKNDPPHCEHAFVTREVRAEAANISSEMVTKYGSIEMLVNRISKLEDAIRTMRNLSFIVGGILVAVSIFLFAFMWWPLLPTWFKDAVPEGVGKGLGGFIGGLITTLLMFAFLRKRI
jgi:deoxycytidine triphosphate deaminase